MDDGFSIRPEGVGDAPAVHAVVAAAFGQADEADLVNRLRVEGAVCIALVAEARGAVVGHVMLSTMTAPFKALALAPVSVSPDWQGRGVGSALVRTSLDAARADGWQGVFVLGDETYYSRFGFDVAAARGFTSPFAGDHFALLSFVSRSTLTEGAVAHAPAFFA